MNKEIQLEKIRLVFEQMIAEKNLLCEPKCSIFINQLINTITFTIQGYLLGEKLEEKKIHYPLNWWEAFKHRWFSDWLVEQFPIKYKTINVSFNVLYPNFKPKLPEKDYVVRMMIND